MEDLDDVNLRVEALDTVHEQFVVSVLLWLALLNATGAPALGQVAHAAVAPAEEVAEDELPDDSPCAHNFVVRSSVLRHVLQYMKHVSVGNVFVAEPFLKRLVVASFICVTEPDGLKMTKAVALNVIFVFWQVGEIISFLIVLVSLDHEEFAHDLVEVIALHVVKDEECEESLHRFNRTTNCREPSKDVESSARNLDFELVQLYVTDKRVPTEFVAGGGHPVRVGNLTHLEGCPSWWVLSDFILLLEFAFMQEKVGLLFLSTRQLDKSLCVDVVLDGVHAVSGVGVHVPVEDLQCILLQELCDGTWTSTVFFGRGSPAARSGSELKSYVCSSSLIKERSVEVVVPNVTALHRFGLWDFEQNILILTFVRATARFDCEVYGC